MHCRIPLALGHWCVYHYGDMSLPKVKARCDTQIQRTLKHYTLRIFMDCTCPVSAFTLNTLYSLVLALSPRLK